MHVCVHLWRPGKEIRHHVLPFSLEKGSLAEPRVRLVTSKLQRVSGLICPP